LVGSTPYIFTHQADRRVRAKPFAPKRERECLGGDYTKAREVFLWSMSVTPNSSVG
jgi:hypothetical protein